METVHIKTLNQTLSAAHIEELRDIDETMDSMTVASQADESIQYKQNKFAADNQKVGAEQLEAENIEEFVLELPTMEAVSKGLWKKMSYKSKTVIVEDESAEVEAEEIEEANESEEEEEDDKAPEEYLEEMKNLIKNQHNSKASRYCKIIRESLEFSKEECEDSQIAENQDYESLKDEVLRILQRRIDQKNYKDTIKQCIKTADKAESDMPLGTGLQSLKKAYKRIIRNNKKI